MKTDLAIAVPHGTYARIAPRSGLAVKNFIDTGAGVVDEDYRGAVGVVLFNHGDADFQGKRRRDGAAVRSAAGCLRAPTCADTCRCCPTPCSQEGRPRGAAHPGTDRDARGGGGRGAGRHHARRRGLWLNRRGQLKKSLGAVEQITYAPLLCAALLHEKPGNEESTMK